MNKKDISYSRDLFTIILLLFFMFLTFITLSMIYNLTNQINVKITELSNVKQLVLRDSKAINMRITGYTPTGNKTALMEDVIVGYTAAVSPNCIHMLGSKVYIKGHGVRRINDLTAEWVADKFNECTLDLAVPSNDIAMKIGNNVSTVVVYE